MPSCEPDMLRMGDVSVDDRLTGGADVRRRGVALMLVVVALTVATMLAVPFLASQSTSTAVGQNIVHHTQAQAAAESGIELALAYIHEQPNWRSQHASGDVLLSDYPLPGGLGTVTVWVENEDPEADEETLDNAVRITSAALVNVPGQSSRTARHTARVRVSGSLESGGGFLPYGIAVAENVTMTGNVRVNSLDSRVDNYSPWAAGDGKARVATNATGNNQFQITGSSRVEGDVLVGHGSNPSQVVKTTGTAGVDGDTTSLEEPMSLPTVTLPTSLPASQGNSSFQSWGQTTINSGTYHYNNFDVSGALTVYIDGDVTIVADDRFRVTGSGNVLLRSGASLTVYAEEYDFSGNSRLKHDDGYDPTAIRLHQIGTNDLDITGSSEVAAAIIAPDAQLDITGNARLFGAFQGKRVRLTGSSRLTQDAALFDQDGGGGGGGGSGDGYEIAWVPVE